MIAGAFTKRAMLAALLPFALGAALATPACDRSLPPQGQIVLYIDTDAPLGPEPANVVPLLFDRLLVELYSPNEDRPCPDCRREIIVDAALMKARRFSFGFVPRPRVVGYRARLIMYRSVSGLAPRASSSIELVGYLPAVAEDGIKEMTARFRTDDVGKPRGTLKAPILFDVGAPQESAIGSWLGARVSECVGDAPSGSLCVPGGAFWMGDPRVTTESEDVGGAKEHLAIVPAFFLDQTEVTVAAIRASKLAKLDSRSRALDPVDDLSDTIAGQCDYSSAPGPNEGLPVTCVSADLAASYCRSKGGDLPSEAELEIVASQRGSSLSPWGDRDPSCEEAVTGRQVLKANDAGGCSDAGQFDIGGRALPLPPGSTTHDRVAVSGGEILDLGANVAEWTRDAFQDDDGVCWTSPILAPPSCPIDNDPAVNNKKRSVKGGDLLSSPVRFAQTRRAYDPTATYPDVGFRCAYPAQ